MTSAKQVIPDDRAQIAPLNAEDIPAIARIERVPEAAVKAAMQSLGNDRAKVVAALRAAKAG